VPAREVEPVADVGVDYERERVEFPGALDLGDGLVVPPHDAEIGGVSVTGPGEVRVQLDGAFEPSLGGGPVPGVGPEIRQHVMRVGEPLVQFHRPPRGGLGFGRKLLRVEHAVAD
jgi:hypothetical protein